MVVPRVVGVDRRRKRDRPLRKDEGYDRGSSGSWGLHLLSILGVPIQPQQERCLRVVGLQLGQ